MNQSLSITETHKMALPKDRIHINAPSDLLNPKNGPQDLALSPEDEDVLKRIGQPLAFRSGECVFGQNERSDYIYLVESGLVRISHDLANGKRQVLAFHWFGDFIGLSVDGKYVNRADALTDVQAIRYRISGPNGLVHAQPSLQTPLLVKATAEIRLMQRRLIVMSHCKGIERLSSFLVELCNHDRPYFNPDTSILKLPMDRIDIADYIGTTRESISRNLTDLTKKRLIIRIDDNTFRIDLPNLKKIAAATSTGNDLL
ncbi:Crp/Fnr family transcriptional regulator [Nguyenibacter vanlangensis]|uniref:Crp/Fnr family transcriptional regulator n=1 Tax=Nguyenibacter vanlangensis TaxID=1216886 RepID=A0ABZ3D0N0_9PROT